ncbi:MAG: hypothetical protein NZL83_01355 [Candidatus Absconditabacterales bacterium]|nr:hypothetical protein [Candidatus Absconditabacterales bacterium]
MKIFYSILAILLLLLIPSFLPIVSDNGTKSECLGGRGWIYCYTNGLYRFFPLWYGKVDAVVGFDDGGFVVSHRYIPRLGESILAKEVFLGGQYVLGPGGNLFFKNGRGWDLVSSGSYDTTAQIPVKNPLYSDLCPNNQSDNAIFDRDNGLLYFRSSSDTSMNVSGVVYQLRHCVSPFFLDDAKITYLDRPLDNYQHIDREPFFLLGDQYVSDKNTIRYKHHDLGPLEYNSSINDENHFCLTQKQYIFTLRN